MSQLLEKVCHQKATNILFGKVTRLGNRKNNVIDDDNDDDNDGIGDNDYISNDDDDNLIRHRRFRVVFKLFIETKRQLRKDLRNQNRKKLQQAKCKKMLL